jgi:hypothetical protein
MLDGAASAIALVLGLEGGMLVTYVGTSAGVYRLAGSSFEPLGLEGERVSALHACRDDGRTTILAGTYENGLYRCDRADGRSGDGGRRWARVEDGLSAVCFRCIQSDPLEAGALLVGTEPARLFRSRDGGRSWRELDGITRIEAHETWFLPYSPRAGDVLNYVQPRLLADELHDDRLVRLERPGSDRNERWVESSLLVEQPDEAVLDVSQGWVVPRPVAVEKHQIPVGGHLSCSRCASETVAGVLHLRGAVGEGVT